MSYIPVFLSEHGVSDAVGALAERIKSYLDTLPPEVKKVSNRQIAKDLGMDNTNTRKWKDAVQRATEIQYEWDRPKGSQSFLRGSELQKYHQGKQLTPA